MSSTAKIITYKKVFFPTNLLMEADLMKISHKDLPTPNFSLVKTKRSRPLDLTSRWGARTTLSKTCKRSKEGTPLTKVSTYQASMVVLNIIRTTITRITKTNSMICPVWIYPTSSSSTILESSRRWWLDFKIYPSIQIFKGLMNKRSIKFRKLSFNRRLRHPKARIIKRDLKFNLKFRILKEVWTCHVGTIIQLNTRFTTHWMSSYLSNRRISLLLVRSRMLLKTQTRHHLRIKSPRMRVCSNSRAIK